MERIDHMQYLPDMEILEDSDIGERVVKAMQEYDCTRYTAADVKRAITAEYLTPEDFGALLSPAALEHPGNGLAGHASELHRGALATKRETREGTEGPLGELGYDDTVPRHVYAPDYLGIRLWDAASLGVWLPQQELGDNHENNGKNSKPRGHENGMASELTRYRAKALLGK